MRVVGVMCASRAGAGTRHLDAARELGERLAGASLTALYGGASVGLMGAMADAALLAGGRVEGVLAGPLVEYGIAHRGLAGTTVAESFAEQQTLMLERSDAFVVLPGGLGTLYELSMVLTAAQLGLHTKPLLVANVDGFYDPLLGAIEHTIAHGFVSPDDVRLLVAFASVHDVVTALCDFRDARPGSVVAAAVDANRGRRGELAALARDLVRHAAPTAP